MRAIQVLYYCLFALINLSPIKGETSNQQVQEIPEHQHRHEQTRSDAHSHTNSAKQNQEIIQSGSQDFEPELSFRAMSSADSKRLDTILTTDLNPSYIIEPPKDSPIEQKLPRAKSDPLPTSLDIQTEAGESQVWRKRYSEAKQSAPSGNSKLFLFSQASRLRTRPYADVNTLEKNFAKENVVKFAPGFAAKVKPKLPSSTSMSRPASSRGQDWPMKNVYLITTSDAPDMSDDMHGQRYDDLISVGERNDDSGALDSLGSRHSDYNAATNSIQMIRSQHNPVLFDGFRSKPMRVIGTKLKLAGKLNPNLPASFKFFKLISSAHSPLVLSSSGRSKPQMSWLDSSSQLASQTHNSQHEDSNIVSASSSPALPAQMWPRQDELLHGDNFYRNLSHNYQASSQEPDVHLEVKSTSSIDRSGQDTSLDSRLINVSSLMGEMGSDTGDEVTFQRSQHSAGSSLNEANLLNNVHSTRQLVNLNFKPELADDIPTQQIVIKGKDNRKPVTIVRKAPSNFMLLTTTTTTKQPSSIRLSFPKKKPISELSEDNHLKLTVPMKNIATTNRDNSFTLSSGPSNNSKEHPADKLIVEDTNQQSIGNIQVTTTTTTTSDEPNNIKLEIPTNEKDLLESNQVVRLIAKQKHKHEDRIRSPTLTVIDGNAYRLPPNATSVHNNRLIVTMKPGRPQRNSMTSTTQFPVYNIVAGITPPYASRPVVKVQHSVRPANTSNTSYGMLKPTNESATQSNQPQSNFGAQNIKFPAQLPPGFASEQASAPATISFGFGGQESETMNIIDKVNISVPDSASFVGPSKVPNRILMSTSEQEHLRPPDKIQVSDSSLFSQHLAQATTTKKPIKVTTTKRINIASANTTVVTSDPDELHNVLNNFIAGSHSSPQHNNHNNNNNQPAPSKFATFLAPIWKIFSAGLAGTGIIALGLIKSLIILVFFLFLPPVAITAALMQVVQLG